MTIEEFDRISSELDGKELIDFINRHPKVANEWTEQFLKEISYGVKDKRCVHRLAYPRGKVLLFLLFKRRWIRKTKFFEDGRVLFSSYVFYSTIDFRTPSELFSRKKKFSSLFNRGTVFLVCL